MNARVTAAAWVRSRSATSSARRRRSSSGPASTGESLRRIAIVRRLIRSTSVNRSGSGLLGDDLAQERSQQAHLARQRVPGAAEAGTRGFGGDGRKSTGSRTGPRSHGR